MAAKRQFASDNPSRKNQQVAEAEASDTEKELRKRYESYLKLHRNDPEPLTFDQWKATKA